MHQLSDEVQAATPVMVCDTSLLFADALVSALNLRGAPACTWEGPADPRLQSGEVEVAIINADDVDAAAETVATVQRHAPGACIVLFVDDPRAEHARFAAHVGAAAVLSRNCSAADVLRAVRLASQRGAPARVRALPAVAVCGWPALTTREREVLRLVSEGHHNVDVADRLQISVHTVRTHMQNILSKLGVSSRLAAASVARQSGLLDPVGQ